MLKLTILRLRTRPNERQESGTRCIRKRRRPECVLVRSVCSGANANVRLAELRIDSTLHSLGYRTHLVPLEFAHALIRLWLTVERNRR